MSEYKTIDMKVEIRRNSDGVVSESVWKDWQWYSTFWWVDGNASCDCYREIWFNEGLNEESNDEIECSHGKYSVRLYDLTNNEILYNEF